MVSNLFQRHLKENNQEIAYLNQIVEGGQLMNQMCDIQVARELIFYQRYLASVACQIEKRNAMRDSYNKIVAARDTNVFWN